MLKAKKTIFRYRSFLQHVL